MANFFKSQNSFSINCRHIELQRNSVITNSVVYEHSVITNRFSGQIGHFTTLNNPVIANKNGRSRAFRYNRASLYLFWPLGGGVPCSNLVEFCRIWNLEFEKSKFEWIRTNSSKLIDHPWCRRMKKAVARSPQQKFSFGIFERYRILVKTEKTIEFLVLSFSTIRSNHFWVLPLSFSKPQFQDDLK